MAALSISATLANIYDLSLVHVDHYEQVRAVYKLKLIINVE